MLPVPAMRKHYAMTVPVNSIDSNHGLGHWLARARRRPLALSLVYACIIVYASLYSSVPWQDRGIDLFGYLFSPWPKYWTWQDACFNVLAYLPLGFLLALSPEHKAWPWARVLLPLILGCLLSATLEAVQTFLPGRVSSGTDLIFNTAGTLIGITLALFFGPHIVKIANSIHQRLGIERFRAEAGVILLALWLFAQISPETVFFGFGDLRSLLVLPTAFPFSADFYSRMETAIAAFQFLVMFFLVQSVLERIAMSRQATFFIALCIIALGILIRVVSSWLLLGPSLGSAADARWVALTAGGLHGIGIGLLLSLPVIMLPSSWRMPMACMLLMAATVLVNLMPTNPYSVTALTVWRQGHFLNFNGLTRLIAALWPYLTLFFLVWASQKRTLKSSSQVY
jgi:VanZ family protein